MRADLGSLYPEILQRLRHLPECKEESLLIVRECFNIGRFEIAARSAEGLPPEGLARCEEILQRRVLGEPLAHILGHFYFYKDKFPVSPETLIPRYDTELLVEEGVKLQPRRILDIGTGTGAVALSLARELPKADITALDIVDAPFKASVQALGGRGVKFIQADFLEENSWQGLGQFGCVISNPPYLDDADMQRLDPSVKDWEPASALYGGADGMIFYRAIEKFCAGHLDEGGVCLLEVDHKWQKVCAIFEGFSCAVKKDYSGLERLLIAQK